MEEPKVVEEMPKKERKKRKPIPIAEYPAIPESSLAIDSKYIKDFIKDKLAKGEMSIDEVRALDERLKLEVQRHNKRAYFGPFRTFFVKKYFPALAAKTEENKKKQNMSQFLEGLL